MLRLILLSALVATAFAGCSWTASDHSAYGFATGFESVAGRGQFINLTPAFIPDWSIVIDLYNVCFGSAAHSAPIAGRNATVEKRAIRLTKSFSAYQAVAPQVQTQQLTTAKTADIGGSLTLKGGDDDSGNNNNQCTVPPQHGAIDQVKFFCPTANLGTNLAGATLEEMIGMMLFWQGANHHGGNQMIEVGGLKMATVEGDGKVASFDQKVLAKRAELRAVQTGGETMVAPLGGGGQWDMPAQCGVSAGCGEGQVPSASGGCQSVNWNLAEVQEVWTKFTAATQGKDRRITENTKLANTWNEDVHVVAETYHSETCSNTLEDQSIDGNNFVSAVKEANNNQLNDFSGHLEGGAMTIAKYIETTGQHFPKGGNLVMA